MANITTGTVTGEVDHSQLHMDHADIRREVANETCKLNDSVKTAGWHNSDRTSSEADRLSNQATQFYISAQKDAHETATALAALKSQVDMQFAASQAAIALAGEKQAAAAALASARTDQLVLTESSKGRDLQRDMEIDRLRADCERNRGWEGRFYAEQTANTNSAIQALNNQLTETRQGVINVGGMMTGNAGRQTSTSTQV